MTKEQKLEALDMTQEFLRNRINNRTKAIYEFIRISMNPCTGLCSLLAEYLHRVDNEVDLTWKIKGVIPAFTFKNALRFEGRDSNYWWPLDAEGDKQRIKFCDFLKTTI